ncbi:hypothetical protein BSKO_09223 [Bryopsis sp. KO-2023]|nr:hypothetical protein BSKO_09223 [Bryopsis sp. KO-2023]
MPKHGKKGSRVKRMLCCCVEASKASIYEQDASGVADPAGGSAGGVAVQDEHSTHEPSQLCHSTLEDTCTVEGGHQAPTHPVTSTTKEIAALVEEIEQLTKKKAIDASSLQQSLRETEGLGRDLEQARNGNFCLEEEVKKLQIQKDFLESQGQAIDARNIRLTRELQRTEEDLEWALQNRRSQAETLRVRQENSSQWKKVLQVVTEQNMPPGMERDVTAKCLRDDLWGLYAMNDSIVEQTQRQSEELGELRQRLFEDREHRDALESELGDWTTKCDMERQRGETLAKELQEVEQELMDYREQLQRRDREKEDLRRWGKQDETEKARLEVETSADSQFLPDVLLALHDVNSNMVAMENQLAALTRNSEHHNVSPQHCLMRMKISHESTLEIIPC